MQILGTLQPALTSLYLLRVVRAALNEGLSVTDAGDETAIAEGPNAARHTVCVLHPYGDWEPWFDDLDPTLGFPVGARG